MLDGVLDKSDNVFFFFSYVPLFVVYWFFLFSWGKTGLAHLTSPSKDSSKPREIQAARTRGDLADSDQLAKNKENHTSKHLLPCWAIGTAAHIHIQLDLNVKYKFL